MESQTLTSGCSMRRWKTAQRYCVGQDFQPCISPSCNSKNQTQKCAKRWKPLHCSCPYSPCFYEATSSDLSRQILVPLYYEEPDKKGESNLVINVNTVVQILWDRPHSPGCLFQLSSCSPMHISVVTRDTGQESYSNWFFFLTSWVLPHVSVS